jgi:L-asparaginase
MGLIDGKDITTEAAITKLMYLFSIPEIDGKVKDLFETSLRGEIGNT